LELRALQLAGDGNFAYTDQQIKNIGTLNFTSFTPDDDLATSSMLVFTNNIIQNSTSLNTINMYTSGFSDEHLAYTVMNVMNYQLDSIEYMEFEFSNMNYPSTQHFADILAKGPNIKEILTSAVDDYSNYYFDTRTAGSVYVMTA